MRRWTQGVDVESARDCIEDTEAELAAVAVGLAPDIAPGHDDGFDAYAGVLVSCGPGVREVESPAGPTGPALAIQ